MALEASQEYQEMYENYIDAVAAFSGGKNTETFRNLMASGIPAAKQEEILKQAGYTFIKNTDGSYSYIGKPSIDPPASDNALITNSNLQTGTSGTNGGAYYEESFGTEGTGTASGNVKESSIKAFASGAAVVGTKVLGIAGKALSIPMAYSFGLNLGKAVEGALYDADPDFWDEKGMQNLDPDTWGEISTQIPEGPARFAFNLLAGVRTPKETGKPTLTMYADEDAQAYFAKWLVEKGFFASQGEVAEPSEDAKSKYPQYVTPIPLNSYPVKSQGNIGQTNQYTDTYTTSENVVSVSIGGYPASSLTSVFYFSKKNFNVTTTRTLDNTGKVITTTQNASNYSAKDNLYWYQLYTRNAESSDYMLTSEAKSITAIGYLALNASYIEGKTGVYNQPNATIFDPSALTSDSTISDYRSAIREQFPDLYNNRLEYSVAQPDGSTKTYTYIPIPIPDGFYQNTEQPISDPDYTAQGNYNYDGSNMSDTQIASILQWLTNAYPSGDPSGLTDPRGFSGPKTPQNTDNTGEGNTPSFIPVTGKASALYAIYNPTLAQVNSLGAWLWSSDFIDQILKLFSDPMQAIIGLHKVFVTPITGGEQNIKVGYLDSGVSSKVVTEQYVTVDCGTIDCAEYFGNVFDYSPYTNIQIYLPFIGIVDLSTSDVMRSKINVVYHVDVLSGACLAEIKVTRDSYGGTLYQYAGNASVTMPISSGSYIGVISNVVGVAARAVSGFAAGGAVGAVAGGVTGALSAHGGTNVQHSGGFSGNAGAMGIKKPYLIIERPQTEIAENTDTLLGYGSNKYVTLSECVGYTRVKAVHVDKISSATQEEKQEIENALMRGVIIR